MYAVFQSGGKQHRVSEGQTVRLEKLDIATGETVEFAEVLTVVARKLKSLSFVVVNTIVSSRAIVSGSLM